jgi:hypothetical protein
MSKKFKGKLCTYCTRAKATEPDHVFARAFFLLEDRAYLPKVPACKPCNNDKSRLELDMTGALPFGARHQQAATNLTLNVPGRLEKNPRLKQELSASMEPAWLREGTGLYQRTSMVNFDGPKLEALLKYIGRGLAWHHWNLSFRPDDDISVMFLKDMAGAAFQNMIDGWRVKQKIIKNLGNGTIEYIGVQAIDPPQLTVWTISMYGGLLLSGGECKTNEPVETCSRWWIVTGPPEINATVTRLKSR